MGGYAFKLMMFAVGILVAGFLAIVIFDRIWYQVGFGAAVVVVVGVLLLIAWLADRREAAKRDDIEDPSSI